MTLLQEGLCVFGTSYASDDYMEDICSEFNVDDELPRFSVTEVTFCACRLASCVVQQANQNFPCTEPTTSV